MAINFWQAQKDAKSNTFYYVTLFLILTFLASISAEWLMRTFAANSYGNPPIPYIGLVFLSITLLTAGLNYVKYLSFGGSYVAESMGGWRINPYTQNPRERQLMNIVEELALATSLPIPPIYIIDAKEINAFAAGTSPENAAIGVTQGTLNLLNRDELQGVLAHEFGHIYHGDTKVGMRMAAMVMGFFIISSIGFRLMQGAAYGLGGIERDDRERRGPSPVMVAALIFLVAGSLMWFFGSILQASISRQREYLADASAVQFTRNPYGIANALRKIEASSRSDMPKSGTPFAHLYFNEHLSFWSNLFATHPPLEERVARLEGGYYKEENLS